MRLVRPFFFVVVLAVAGGCAKTEWREFTSSQDKFKVLFPGTPKEQKLNAPEGPTTTYGVETKKGTYIVSVGPVPKEADLTHLGEVLKAKSQEAVEGMGGSVSGVKDVKNGDLQGVEASGGGKAKDRDMAIRLRMFIVPGKFYHVMALGEPAFVNSQDATRFLDSFQIVR